MRNCTKFLLLAAILAYVISPVDALPGPVDDLLLIALSTAFRILEHRRGADISDAP